MVVQRKLEKDIRSPLEYGLDIFGKKWSLRIICALAYKQPMRYGELKEFLGEISDTMLATSIKALSDGGMLIRTSYEEVPVRVEYSLTAKSCALVPLLCSICRWAQDYCSMDYDKLSLQCNIYHDRLVEQYEEENHGSAYHECYRDNEE